MPFGVKYNMRVVPSLSWQATPPERGDIEAISQFVNPRRSTVVSPIIRLWAESEHRRHGCGCRVRFAAHARRHSILSPTRSRENATANDVRHDQERLPGGNPLFDFVKLSGATEIQKFLCSVRR